MLPDQRTHGCYKDSHHTSLEHSGNTGAYIGQKLHRCDMSSKKHDKCAGDNSDQKYHKYIDADDTADQHQNIWKDLYKMIILYHSSLDFCLKRQDKDQSQCNNSCRKCDPEIFPEFILHLTALTVAGCDRGIRNKRKVVTKHGSSHHRCHTKCHIKTGSFGNRYRNRSKKRDSPNGSSHSHRYEAGHYKQYRNRKTCRYQRKHTVGHTFCTAAPHNTHKRACGQKDQKHGDDIFISYSFCHKLQLSVKANRSVLNTCHQDRRQKSHNDRYIIKSHGDLHHILEQNSQSQIQNQKNTDRQQCDYISFFLHFLHKTIPFITYYIPGFFLRVVCFLSYHISLFLSCC